MTNLKPILKKSRVTHISLSRLYNLGNYQNVKYDLTVEVAPGESAEEAFKAAFWILKALRPLRVPECKSSFEQCQNTPEEQQSEYQKAHRQEWADELSRYQLAKSQQGEAVALLSDLGGCSKYIDHKDKWNDNEDTPF